ncbi:hypothetical protein [Peptacetobacter sp. AB845]|uniref:hypothetical protein n=1 Tax=Peptacetobacter sp. AB845 TaxID=3388429 RepID=UPI0039C8C317
MSFLGAVCSVVMSGASAVCSCIASVGAKLGGIVGGAISKLGEIISKIPDLGIGEVINIVDTVSKIVEVVSKLLGISTNDNTEELGAKALECDKKPDDFDTVGEYIKYVENEIELDKEKFNSMSKEEKAVCSAVGAGILLSGISENKKVDVEMDFIVEAAKQGFSAKEINDLIDKFKEHGVALNLSKYLKGELTSSENKEFTPVLKEYLKEVNPDLDEDGIEQRIDEMMEIAMRK